MKKALRKFGSFVIRWGIAVVGVWIVVSKISFTELRAMVRQANPWMLLLSVAVFPITIVLTSIRWEKLLKALDIPLTLWRTASINWVGLFYNTFIPMGSTGGDLLKAYYAAKQTHYKTRAVMSVIVDRVIGLVVLVIMGGAIAGGYYLAADDKHDPAVLACRHVAVMASLIIAGCIGGLLVVYTPSLRKLIGFEKLLAKLPLQHHVRSAIEVMTIYRRRPGLMIWAMLVTFPVHLTVVVSALLAGQALGLPLTWGYYFIVVPVTVLVGAIPISPQGAGVMELFAASLMMKQPGATMNHVVALTMSIRLVQILWNLVGGAFVISGNYRAPKRVDLDDDVAVPDAIPSAAAPPRQ